MVVHQVWTLYQLFTSLSVDCLLVFGVVEIGYLVFVLVFLNEINNVHLLYVFVSSSWRYLLTLVWINFCLLIEVCNIVRAWVFSLPFRIITSFIICIASHCIHIETASRIHHVCFDGALLIYGCFFSSTSWVCVAALLQADQIISNCSSFFEFSINFA